MVIVNLKALTLCIVIFLKNNVVFTQLTCKVGVKSFKNDALSTGALGTDCSEPETKQCIRMDLNKMREMVA